jgi:hypothetical protein
MKRSCAIVLWLVMATVLVVNPSYLAASEPPFLTKFLHDYLVSTLGMHYAGRLAGGFTYSKPGHTVWFRLDNSGNVREGGTGFNKNCDSREVSGSLYVIYATLQLNMGKGQVLDSKMASSKMFYLLDAINANLKIGNVTKFPYDDLIVYAKKYPEKNTVVIILSLR